MEDGRKKIWICVAAAVLAAVVIGLLYYLSVPQEKSGEGFLIRTPGQEQCCAAVLDGEADYGF